MTMAKPKMGLVGLCSHFESGGQRHDELISSAAKAMEAAGIDVVVANRSVWDPVDAMDVCDQFTEAGNSARKITGILVRRFIRW